ncbi:aldose epimerase [Nonomuraea sp. NPDC050643]|uniref:aldose epimerase family protein n=1 Tax=Nonomuraea sp. NPDC050643 TaxID=3155660 RepID=UPI00340654F3
MPKLAADGYTAQISRRGAGICMLRHGDRDLLTSWPEDGPAPFYAATILAPWPNRVAFARYVFAGHTHVLPVNEPERGHALHGLVAEADWRITDARDDLVRLEHTIPVSPGYPSSLDLRVEHRLGGGGLTTTVTARNVGGHAAPYGCGTHPWLLGDVLELHAAQVLETDGDLLPVRLADVPGTPYDFATPRQVGGQVIDNAYTGLRRGEARAGGVRVSWDPDVLPWVQVCTSHQLGYEGLAVEPMTCPPDAFNSQVGLVVLRPGDEHVASWTISAV